jgi:hypothetical protein
MIVGQAMGAVAPFASTGVLKNLPIGPQSNQ